MRRALLSLCAGVLALTACWLGAISLPGVPYNVRELFDRGPPAFTALLLTAALYWCFGQPALLAVWLNAGTWKRFLALPVVLACGGAVTFGLLRVAVPLESIHDVVGAPVLGWPWEWGLLGRFMALFAGPALLFAVGAALVASMLPGMEARPRDSWLRWAACSALLLPVVHWVVVANASTDNLTELMSRGGTWGSSAFLGLWLLSVGFAGARLSSLLAGAGPRVLPTISVIAGSLPLGYLLLWSGTEQAVEKYGQVFSALQFLLSPNREHLATGAALALRYVLVHVALILFVAVTQHPVWVMVKERIRPSGFGRQTGIPTDREGLSRP